MKDAICFENNKNIIFHTDPPDHSWELLPGEIHLWIATVESAPDFSLSAEEQQEFNTIKHPFSAQRFKSTRKLLRYLFHAYLQCSNYHLHKTDQGKPFLPAFPAFHFNVTHSKKIIIVALSQAPVGVDLERMRDLEVLRIAKRFFSPQELVVFQHENQKRNREIFFKLWTAKEAALKADGQGIAIGMKNNIAVMEGEHVSSIELGKESWKIHSWNLSEGDDVFFGAVATSFAPTVIHWHDLRPCL